MLPPLGLLLLLFAFISTSQGENGRLGLDVVDWVGEGELKKSLVKTLNKELLSCTKRNTKQKVKKCVKNITKPYVNSGKMKKKHAREIWKGLYSLVSTCPYSGSGETMSILLLGGTECYKAQKKQQCGYNWFNVPLGDEMTNKCVPGELDCIPSSGCTCNEETLTWSCWTAKLGVTCEGEVPDGTLENCFPDSIEIDY